MARDRRSTDGQASVELIGAAAVLLAVAALLSAALVDAWPASWAAGASERARARERLVEGAPALAPDWSRARRGFSR